MPLRPALLRLDFEGGFDERALIEAKDRGYLSHMIAVLDDGSRYRVTFFDPTRLLQDVESEFAAGLCYFTEPGLIVVAEVTLEHMLRALRELAKTAYFESLARVKDGQ